MLSFSLPDSREKVWEGLQQLWRLAAQGPLSGPERPTLPKESDSFSLSIVCLHIRF